MPELGKVFRVLAPERRGHGHTPDVDGPFSYDDMAADTIRFLEAVVAGPAHLVGWSDGGIIGLIVAMRRPDLVRKLVAISANFDTSGVPEEILSHFLSMQPDSEDLAMLRSMYEAASPDGPDHWPVVFAKFIEMASREPHIPIPNAELVIVPGTSHFLTMEKPDVVNRLILDFIQKDPSPTMMPIRRADPGTHAG